MKIAVGYLGFDFSNFTYSILAVRTYSTLPWQVLIDIFFQIKFVLEILNLTRPDNSVI